MATLKDHQQAMVDLLASGSGIPASAMRLAHAMHDVLAYLNLEEAIHHAPLYGADATTPGLNDKALAGDLEACRPKATPAERRVKELENTVRQLRASNAKLRAENSALKATLEFAETQTTEAQFMASKLQTAEKRLGRGLRGVIEHQEQAGCRKPDVEV